MHQISSFILSYFLYVPSCSWDDLSLCMCVLSSSVIAYFSSSSCSCLSTTSYRLSMFCCECASLKASHYASCHLSCFRSSSLFLSLWIPSVFFSQCTMCKPSSLRSSFPSWRSSCFIAWFCSTLQTAIERCRAHISLLYENEDLHRFEFDPTLHCIAHAPLLHHLLRGYFVCSPKCLWFSAAFVCGFY